MPHAGTGRTFKLQTRPTSFLLLGDSARKCTTMPLSSMHVQLNYLAYLVFTMRSYAASARVFWKVPQIKSNIKIISRCSIMLAIEENMRDFLLLYTHLTNNLTEFCTCDFCLQFVVHLRFAIGTPTEPRKLTKLWWLCGQEFLFFSCAGFSILVIKCCFSKCPQIYNKRANFKTLV